MPSERDPKETPTTLASSRVPQGVKDVSTKTVGVLAVNDSIMLIAACWLGIFLLWFSLRSSNV